MCKITLQDCILPLLTSAVGAMSALIIKDEYKRWKRKKARFENDLTKDDFKKIVKFEEIELVDFVVNPQNQHYLDGGCDPSGFGSYILLQEGNISLRFQNLDHILIDKTSEEYWKLSGKFGVTKLGSNRSNLQLLLTPKG